jgi:hypothetical protein
MPLTASDGMRRLGYAFLPFPRPPPNNSNLILFATTLLKAINQLHRQKNKLFRHFQPFPRD